MYSVCTLQQYERLFWNNELWQDLPKPETPNQPTNQQTNQPSKEEWKEYKPTTQM